MLIFEIYLSRRSLIFQVAEFANVRKQLEVLEDRLDEMVLPRLVDALSNRKVVLVSFVPSFFLYVWTVDDNKRYSMIHIVC